MRGQAKGTGCQLDIYICEAVYKWGRLQTYSVGTIRLC